MNFMSMELKKHLSDFLGNDGHLITSRPGSIVDFAKAKGFEVFTGALGSEYVGAIVFDDSRSIRKILVRPDLDVARMRMVIAHELAHFAHVGDKGALIANKSMYADDDPKETEMDVYASILLLPQKFLYACVTKLNEFKYSSDAINKFIATKYTVPVEAVILARGFYGY